MTRSKTKPAGDDEQTNIPSRRTSNGHAAEHFHDSGRHPPNNEFAAQDGFLSIKDVKDSDRAQLINYVYQRPVIWQKDYKTDTAHVTMAWKEIAREMSSPGRGFDVKLVMDLWNYLRNQYVKIMKSEDPSTSNWRYIQPMAFLGEDFGQKKPQFVDDENVPPKKKAKQFDDNLEEEMDRFLDLENQSDDQYSPHQRFGQQPLNGHYSPHQQFGHYTSEDEFDQNNGMNPEMSYHQQQQEPFSSSRFNYGHDDQQAHSSNYGQQMKRQVVSRQLYNDGNLDQYGQFGGGHIGSLSSIPSSNRRPYTQNSMRLPPANKFDQKDLVRQILVEGYNSFTKMASKMEGCLHEMKMFIGSLGDMVDNLN